MKLFSYVKKVPYWYLLAIPLLLVISGAASNQCVIVANWGKFPVMMNERVAAQAQKNACIPDDIFGNIRSFSIFDTSVSADDISESCEPSQFLDDTHSIMGRNSHLKILADVINLGDSICSIGDLLIWLGTWLLRFTPIMWLTLMLRKVMIGF